VTQRKKTVLKKSRKKKAKKIGIRTQLKKGLGGLLVLIVLVVIAGVMVHQFIKRQTPASPAYPTATANASVPPKPEIPKPVPLKPRYEVYPHPKVIDKPAAVPVPRPQSDRLPKVAIIIDDIGYDRGMANKFLSMDTVLTFSILPYSPFQENILKAVRSKGWETMLHLPMEPDEYPRIKPGPGALLTSMTPDELISQLALNIAAVPGVKGVNNHMGSRMTAVSTQMNQVFSILKKKGLFFIDSRTCNRTLCRPSARLMHLPFAERDIFIDHLQTPDFIRRQLKKLIRTAQKNGQAIGIAHPHLETYKILREMLPELQKKVRLVPASTLVHVVG